MRVGTIIASSAVIIFDLALFLLSADGSPLDFEGPLVTEGPFATEALTNDLPSGGEPLPRDFAFSDFFASRDTDCGIRIDPIYWGECFTNARGGIATAGATQYQGLLDLWLMLDFERLRIPVWGKFQILAENSHGRGLTQDFVGDSMVLSNIDPLGNVTQVGEYWWEVNVLDDAVTFRLGKQDVNREFYFLDTAGDFVQSGFTLSPNAYLPSYPHQTMAAVALMQLKPSLQLKVGVWDTLADQGSWGLSSQDTVLTTGELEYTYTLPGSSLPGKIALGALYQTASEFLGEESGGGHGYELQIEQTIFRERESDTEDPQGLEVFAALYPQFHAGPVLVDEIGDSFAAGMVYTGLLSGRDRDAIGAGIVSAELFLGGTNRETSVEVYYWAVVTDHVCLQPDLQYIATPSGIYPDALVAGLRIEVDL